MQPIWEITIRNKQLSWTFFSTFTQKLASVALPAQKVPSIVQDTSQARDLHHWQNAYVHMVRNMSLWGVGSSAQSLNSAQDWEGNLLLICSQCRAHRSKYFMQSGNDHTHTPCLGFCYYQEHKNLKSESLWRDSAHLLCSDECLGVFLCWRLGSE